MSAARIQKILLLAALVLGIGVVSFHAAFKRPVEAHSIAGLNAYREESTRWQGKFPPDFELPLRNGESFRLAEHIGREVIILNFFTTWCMPCRQEMPELNAYALKNRGKPFVLLGINVDEKPDKVDAYGKELGLSFPVGIDTNGLIAGRYGVGSYPTTVFIGADGRVGLFQIGGIANADVVLAPLVAPQLEVIQRGRGIDRLAYETGLTNQPSPIAKTRTAAARAHIKNEPAIPLTGSAKDFAGRMKCPSCGNSLYTCNCGLCNSVKERLVTMNVTNKTDEQVLHELFLEAKAP